MSHMRDRLSAANMWSLLAPTYCSGPRIMLAPAATVTLASPLRSNCTAWLTATRLDEQAVSIAIEGPCQSKK